jgi:hypothetical protein
MATWMAGNPGTLPHWAAVVCIPVLWAVVTYRLGRAYRHYLKFDHPWATVIASQIIVTLAAAIIALNVALAQMR